MIRLFSRTGHIHLLRNEIELAIAEFERASHVDRRRSAWEQKPRAYLTGRGRAPLRGDVDSGIKRIS